MIRTFLGSLFTAKKEQAPVSDRKKLFFDEAPDVVYAIGDVHGCYDLLQSLEAKIAEDARDLPGKKWLIMLGDYVDRGPKSAAVLDKLCARPQIPMERLCLAGNHEDVMLDFLRNPSANHRWLEFGGRETLHSYGIYRFPENRKKFQDLIASHVPEEHFTFLSGLPSLISFPGLCFVHAGLEEGVPLADQNDATLLWSRPGKSENATTNPFVTVHGHTPVKTVETINGRINVDTGAYASGILSAVKISCDGTATVLRSG